MIYLAIYFNLLSVNIIYYVYITSKYLTITMYFLVPLSILKRCCGQITTKCHNLILLQIICINFIPDLVELINDLKFLIKLQIKT